MNNVRRPDLSNDDLIKIDNVTYNRYNTYFNGINYLHDAYDAAEMFSDIYSELIYNILQEIKSFPVKRGLVDEIHDELNEEDSDLAIYVKKYKDVNYSQTYISDIRDCLYSLNKAIECFSWYDIDFTDLYLIKIRLDALNNILDD